MRAPTARRACPRRCRRTAPARWRRSSAPPSPACDRARSMAEGPVSDQDVGTGDHPWFRRARVASSVPANGSTVPYDAHRTGLLGVQPSLSAPPRSGGEREDVEGGVGAPWRAVLVRCCCRVRGGRSGLSTKRTPPTTAALRGRPYAAIAIFFARSLRSPPPSPSFSKPAAVAACEAVNRADETSRREGVSSNTTSLRACSPAVPRTRAWALSWNNLSVLRSGTDVDRVEPGPPWLHSEVRACHWNCAKNLQISALVQVVTPLSPEEPSTGPGMWPPSNAAHWTGYPARQPE